uniref:DM2 domain-containing protein n=1 Tax=Strigamia maritima TaxID=126957 RepID=T1IW43_STRMM
MRATEQSFVASTKRTACHSSRHVTRWRMVRAGGIQNGGFVQRNVTGEYSRKKEVDAMILSMINQSTDGGARSQANGASDQSESDSDNDEESDDEYSPKKKKFKGGMQQSPPQQQQPTQQQQAPPPMGMQTMSMQPPSMSMPPMQMGMGMHPMGMQPMGMHQPMHQPMHPHQGMHPGMQPMMMKHYTDPSWNYLQPNYQDDKSKMMPMMPTPAPPPAPSAPATTKGSRKGTSTYSKKCILSPELAEVMGATEMARHEVVKKMWQIVKERNLADPKNKQFAVCDDQLLKIFGNLLVNKAL